MLYFLCLLIAFVAVYYKLDMRIGIIIKIWLIGSLLYIYVKSVHNGFTSGWNWNITRIENQFHQNIPSFKVRSNRPIVFQNSVLNPEHVIFNRKSSIIVNNITRKVVYIDDQI